MTKFRPCIDIHDGKVKQIVGSSLADSGKGLETNFESDQSPAWFASLYKKDNLKGGHVIMLGQGNEKAAKEALAAYPGGLQIGGGISTSNALEYLDAGASHVIVTSWIFQNNELSWNRIAELSHLVGIHRLVIDLSCKRNYGKWNVATNRWQTITSTEITRETLNELSLYCNEFLVHAADVEGKQQGMDEELISFLGENSHIPVTYAGGARNISDLHLCDSLSNGRVDLTIGSALDIFGGKGAKYFDCIRYNKEQK